MFSAKHNEEGKKNKKKWEKVYEKKRQIHNFASLSVLKWLFDRQMKQTRLKAHIYTHILIQVIGLRSKKRNRRTHTHD